MNDDINADYSELVEWAEKAPILTVKHPSGMYTFTGRLIEYVPHQEIEGKHEVVKIEVKDFNMNVTVGETWEITDWEIR